MKDSYMYLQLSKFLGVDHIRPNKHSGFRKGPSTKTANITLMSYMKFSTQYSGKFLILLDFSRALDTINMLSK